jgi:hypothetical protein
VHSTMPVFSLVCSSLDKSTVKSQLLPGTGDRNEPGLPAGPQAAHLEAAASLPSEASKVADDWDLLCCWRGRHGPSEAVQQVLEPR